MRWSVFAIAAYLAMVVQVGLGKHLAVDTAAGSVGPRFVLLLLVFVALSAPTRVVVIAGAVLGLLMDLVSSPYALTVPQEAQSLGPMAVTLIGPYTLGYIAGAYLVVQLRPMLFRHHPMAIAAMTLVAGAEAHLVVLGLLWIRQWYEPVAGFDAAQQLVPRALGLLYTAGIGLFLAFPLVWSAPLFGFPPLKSHKPALPSRRSGS